MHIVDVLTQHHARLRQLFLAAETDAAVAETLIRELTVHHTMEERFFYDFLLQPPQGHETALEHVNEHHIIEMILTDLAKFPREHEIFPTKIESLAEYTDHHLGEEEAVVFPLARSLFGPAMAEALGAKFQQAVDLLLSIQVPPASDVPVEFLSPPAGGTPEAQPQQPGDGATGEAGADARLRLIQGLGIGSLKRRAA